MIVLTIPVLGAAVFVYLSLGRAQKSSIKARFRRLQPFRLRQLLKIAKDVLHDTNDALNHIQNPAAHPELRALIPIVSEVRKRVAKVLAKDVSKQAKFWNATVCEDLKSVLKELMKAEELLRSIPKTKLTLEQVLAGHFDSSESITTMDAV